MKEIFLGNFPEGKGGIDLLERRRTVIHDERKGRVVSRESILLAGDPTAVILPSSLRVRDGITTRFQYSHSHPNSRDMKVFEVVVRDSVKI